MLSQSNGIPPAYVSYLGSNRQLIDPKTGVVYQLARVESDSDAELSPNQFSSDGGGVLPYMRFIPPPSFPPPPIPTYDHNSRMSKSADYSSPSEGYFSQWRNLTDNNNSASHLSFSSSFCEDHCRGDQFCSRNYHRSPRGEDSMPTIYEAPSIQSYCSAAVAPTTSFQQRHQQPNSTRLDNYNCYSYELDLSGDNLTGRQRNSRKFSSLRD